MKYVWLILCGLMVVCNGLHAQEKLRSKVLFDGRFTELYSLLFVDGNPAGVKALLHEMGFIENVLRLPLVPTRITTLQKMTEILKTLKI